MTKFVLSVGIFAIFGLPAFAQEARTTPAAITVPRLVAFSGTLRDAAGTPLRGTQALTFSIYPDQDSRTPLWQEKQNVQADEQGHYTVQLGAATDGMPLELFQSGTPLWLGVQQQGSGAAEQARVLLVSVPYALKAADADTLGGKPVSAFVTREAAPASGNEATAAANTRAAAALSSGLAGTGTADYIPLWTDGTDLGNSLLFEFGNNIGLGTITPSARFQLLAPSAATKGLIVQGAASQSANLQEWQNSAGTALGYVNSSGSAYFPTAGVGNAGPQPGSTMLVQQAFGNPSGTSVTGMTVNTSMTPTSAGSVQLLSANDTAGISGSVGTAGTVYGSQVAATSSVTSGGSVRGLVGGRFVAVNSGTGTVTDMYGGEFLTSNQSGGTATDQYGGYFSNTVSSSSKVTNVYGNFIAAPAISGGGTAANAYGLYLQNVTGATTNNYSIYSAGGTNYFGGNVGIGTATPAAKLEVNGTAKFDGLVTFAAGQSFPSGGSGQFTGGNGADGVDATGGSGRSGVKGTGGDAGSGDLGGDGLTGIGGNGFIGGVGVRGTGGQNSGPGGALTGGSGSGDSAGGIGAKAVGGASLGTGSPGEGLNAQGGASISNATNGAPGVVATGGIGVVGGDGVVASGGTAPEGAAPVGMAGRFKVYGGVAPRDVVIGDPGCNASGGAGIAFVPSGGRMSGCTNYAIWGDGVTLDLFSSASGAIQLFGAYTYVQGQVGIGIAPGSAELNLNSGGTASADTLLIGNNSSKGLQLRDNGTGVDIESIGVPLYLNFITKQNIYLSGDVSITGNFSASGTKNFRIDHPLDPENKELYHASIESSEVLNQYSGNVVLDDNGQATVTFPEWFGAINTDFRYQLTAIGKPAPGLYIAEEILDNRFRLAGGTPGLKVSWQVTARRNDAYMKAHPFVVEREKTASVRRP